MSTSAKFDLSELEIVLLEALANLLGSFAEAEVATDAVVSLMTENVSLSEPWELRIHFLEDAYETSDMVPADLAFTYDGSDVTIRQMTEPDLWYSHSGWRIGQRLCSFADLSDGYLVVGATNG